MSHTIEFTWQGLSVEAGIDEYDPGDRIDPPSGGVCEDAEWTVDDIDEVLEHLEIESEAIEQMVRALYKYTGKLPAILASKIDGWDIEEAATEFFWNDIGGPGGLEDYYND